MTQKNDCDNRGVPPQLAGRLQLPAVVWLSVHAVVFCGCILLVAIVSHRSSAVVVVSPTPEKPSAVPPARPEAQRRTPVAPPAPTKSSQVESPSEHAQRTSTLEQALAVSDPARWAAIEPFMDTARPIEERLAQITELGARSDEQSMLTLMALGNASTYVNYAAIEALGSVRQPEVIAYLRNKLSDPDARIIASAVRSYGQLLGDDAVPDLLGVIQANQMRPDGFEQSIRTQAVETLGEIGSDHATPTLVAELGHAGDPAWDLEYGSTVVLALRHIGDPAATPGLDRYAAQLTARLPDDSPRFAPTRQYVEQKIAEVRTTIAVLQADAVDLERLAPAAVDPTVDLVDNKEG